MTSAELDRATPTIEDVATLARTRSDDIARECRLTEDVVDAITASGLLRSYLPPALGGNGATLRETLDALASISAGDASTGWCAAVSAGTKAFASYVPESAAREIWADPDEGNGSSFQPTGEAVALGGDRYVVSGRWRFTSNCLHSDHLGLGALFRADAGADPEPVPRLVFVPRDAVEIVETWDVLGLRGTGSHDIAATGVEIDRSWSCAFTDRPWSDDALAHVPIFTKLMPPLAAVPLGIARGAIDEIVGRVDSGASPQTRGSLADKPVAMADLAAADAALRAAHAGVGAALDRVWDLATRGEPIDQRHQALVMSACAHATATAEAATDTMHRLTGAGGSFAADRVLRALIDVKTARQHIAFDHANRSIYGQALCGRPVFAPPFFL